ncbi:hypothetical protein KAI58_00640 [Candidatus Gracilibacteria bacterium]|nr:hypothetical protein [Candidatus Gracilibacteria bacterium]
MSGYIDKKMEENIKPQKLIFNPGAEIFSWMAHDYHPHNRGIVWYIIFCTIIFGSAFWSLFIFKDWIMSLVFFLVAAVYFLVHRNGEENHIVRIFENGLLIDDRQFYNWKQFSGFWFLYDETISVVNFQIVKKDRKIALQLGDLDAETVRNELKQVELIELKDKTEPLLDLWIRGLKL